jgi:acylphosphatase
MQPKPQKQTPRQVRLKIFGDVQGVLFRIGAQEKANSLQISGWVKNEPDGTVSIHAAGAPGNLQTFIDWCKTGPESARVDKVETEYADSQDPQTAPGDEGSPGPDLPSNFEIRY